MVLTCTLKFLGPCFASSLFSLAVRGLLDVRQKSLQGFIEAVSQGFKEKHIYIYCSAVSEFLRFLKAIKL